jgi:hypothetical protein
MPWQGRPGDRAILEFHTDAIAIVRQFLTINHLPVDRFFIERSDLHRVAGLPGELREYASAVRTDVVGEGSFFFIVVGRFRKREGHHHDDRHAPFGSAAGPVLQMFLAQTFTGYREVWGGALIRA